MGDTCNLRNKYLFAAITNIWANKCRAGDDSEENTFSKVEKTFEKDDDENLMPKRPTVI